DRPVDELLRRRRRRLPRQNGRIDVVARPAAELADEVGGERKRAELRVAGDEIAPGERHRRVVVPFGAPEEAGVVADVLPFAAIAVGRHRLLAAAELGPRLAVLILAPLVHFDAA